MNLSKNGFVSLLQFIAGSMLLSAFAVEFLFHVSVCNLCILQRSLWVLLIIITTFLKNKGVILLILLVAILVSAYHVLLQYNIISESQVCAISLDISNEAIPCNIRDFEIFYLPLPAYNFIINILLFIFVVKKMNTRKENKNEQPNTEENL
ncbi:MAG: disulfide bond formation protein B [Alphaproteobacteria bacterium]|jgi:disulfide bond formation protein DsbB|nr:disulfide bond formation protein B [Alphaproteobacteria bacterium]